MQQFRIKDNANVYEEIVQKRKMIPVSIIQRQDPIKEAILKDTDYSVIETQISQAMRKIKGKILDWATKSNEVSTKLESTVGRDTWVYRGFFHRNNTLKECIENWDESWSFRQTCGLLLDLGNNLRHFCKEQDVMNDIMKNSRLDGHNINRDSKWAKGLPKGTNLQSGVSATTGNLLRLLRHLDTTSIEEIESIMVGVISYWENGSWIKWILGSFHTAAEVWSAYTYYLHKYQYDKDIEADLQSDDSEPQDL